MVTNASIGKKASPVTPQKNQPEAQKPAGKNNLIVEVLNALTHGVGVAVGILFLVLRIFDHVANYLFIAGTFTPGILLLLTGRSRILFLVVIWALAMSLKS